MALLSCRLCGKIFNSPGSRTCAACMVRLDELYVKVREFLRDNPKKELDVEMLSEELGADILEIQTLVDMGYLDRDVDSDPKQEDRNKQRLAKELENSIKQMKDSSAQRDAVKAVASSYGQQRYGEKNKKK